MKKMEILKDYAGWDLRIWPLAILTGWPPHQQIFLIRKCMRESLG